MAKKSDGRVLVSLINTPFTRADGTTFRARQVLRLLAPHYKTFATVLHYSGSSNPLVPEPGVTTKILPGKFYLYKFLIYPYAFLQSIRIRPVLVYMVNDRKYFDYYYFLTRFLAVPLIYEVHSILSKEVKEMGESQDVVDKARAVETKIMPLADQIVVLSDEAEEFYRPLNPRITIIPAMVQVEEFRPIEKIDPSGKTKSVGLIGPFDNPRKQAELRFIHENLGKFDERIRFKIIGTCKERIEAPRIEYLGFMSTRQEFLERLSSLDAVIVPSRIATFGPLTKIVEPMVFGVPVYTTPKGINGLSHLRDGVNVFIAPEDRLPERMNATIFDNGLMHRVGEEAKRMIKDHYSTEVNSKKLFDLLDRTLAHNRGR